MAKEAHKYSEFYAGKLREKILKGLPVTKAFEGTCHLQEAPGSLKTVYVYYKRDIERARADFAERIAEKAGDAIDEGNSKILELAIKTHLGWNPSVKVEEKDDENPDEHSDAVDTLAGLLKRPVINGEEEE